MNWNCYQLTFRIRSPLHIGFHKVMHFYRTRYYFYGKLLWGAMTARLAPLLGTDYRQVGAFLKEAIRFGYFYLSTQDEIYIPRYTDKGLKFGSLSLSEFERKIVSSIASTAIEPNLLTAEEGMLYEVDFINPYTIDEAAQVRLKGLIWLRELDGQELQLKYSDDNWFIIFNNQNNVFFDAIKLLQVGGEKRCGFGLIECIELNRIEKGENTTFSGSWEENNQGVIITLQENEPIWAHALFSQSLEIKGDIEPIVGREWDETQKGAGRKLVSSGLYWSPGSVVLKKTKFKIQDYGTWEIIC